MEIFIKLTRYILIIVFTKCFSFIFNIYIYAQLDSLIYGKFQYYFSLISMIFIPFVDSLLDLKLINKENNELKILKIKSILFAIFSVFLILYTLVFKLNLTTVLLFTSHYFFLGLRSYNVSLLRRSLLFKFEKIIMFVEKSLPIILLIILYFLNISLTLNIVIGLLLISSVTSVLVSILVRRFIAKKQQAINIQKENSINLKHTLFAILASYFMAVYFKVDQIMIGNLLGEKQIANYALSVKFLEVFFLFPGLCMSYFFPHFTEQIKNHSLQAKKHLALFLLLGALLSCAFALMHLVDHQYITNIKPFFTPWIFTLIAVTLGHYLTQILVALKREKVLLYITLFAVIINCVLNYLTVPNFGPKAAAYSTLATESIVVILCLLETTRNGFKIKNE